MNNNRRKELNRALPLLAEALEIIESVKDEEQDAFDCMPEGLQTSERGETMENNVSVLDDAICNINDSISNVEEII